MYLRSKRTWNHPGFTTCVCLKTSLTSLELYKWKTNCARHSFVQSHKFNYTRSNLFKQTVRAHKTDKSLLSEAKMSASELSCSFSSICQTRCDISRRNPNFTGFYTLNSCLKDIKPHLKRLNVAQKCVASEGELILARAGLFDGDVSGFTICP